VMTIGALHSTWPMVLTADTEADDRRTHLVGRITSADRRGTMRAPSTHESAPQIHLSAPWIRLISYFNERSSSSRASSLARMRIWR
jgi:hypothetical protein